MFEELFGSSNENETKPKRLNVDTLSHGLILGIDLSICNIQSSLFKLQLSFGIFFLLATNIRIKNRIGHIEH